jgi:hypothetical protein
VHNDPIAIGSRRSLRSCIEEYDCIKIFLTARAKFYWQLLPAWGRPTHNPQWLVANYLLSVSRKKKTFFLRVSPMESDNCNSTFIMQIDKQG